jgi:two-component system, NarL family, nitrate/nitrite response regulator NarL
MIRVLIADNSRIHTQLLADALRRDPAIEVIPFQFNHQVATGLVAAAADPGIDVLVISANLDEQPSCGIDAVRKLRALRPDARAILLLDSSKDEVVLHAFRSGARGVFDRNEDVELLIKCVRCVYEGEIWASNQHLHIAMGGLASAPTVRALNSKGMSLLSERELQVVHCLAEGLTNREIAERLKLSRHTIKNYFFRIFDKLGVSSRVELLFMTLSQTSSPEALMQLPAKESQHDRNGYSWDESELLKKSAEAGLPAAQLALAQLYLNRRRSSQDLVDAYMWYIVATERALQARAMVANMMTPQQMNEGKQKASVWLAKRKPPAPTFEDPSSQPKRAAALASKVQEPAD